jgi:hypothetical protein
MEKEESKFRFWLNRVSDVLSKLYRRKIKAHGPSYRPLYEDGYNMFEAVQISEFDH